MGAALVAIVGGQSPLAGQDLLPGPGLSADLADTGDFNKGVFDKGGDFDNGGDFEAGIVAFLEGDYRTAAAQWRPLAEGGDAVAQYNLGSLYLMADQTAAADTASRDVVEAAWWLAKAARQGHGRAQYALAKIFRDGMADASVVAPGAPGVPSVPADAGAALDWLAAAAMQGHGPAQVDLGLAYMGRGSGALARLPRDNGVAWQWLSLARDQGEGAAVAALADLAPWLSADQRAVAEAAAATLVSQQTSGRAAATKF